MTKRFNPAKYDPATDSSASSLGWGDETDNVGVYLVTADSEGPLCECGCEHFTPAIRKGKSSFIQGHDARLKGKLIRAYLSGHEVFVAGGGMLMSSDAMTLAEHRGWGHFLTAAKNSLEARPTPKARKAQTVELKIAGGKVVQATVVGPVGKGQVEYEYTNAKGEAKRVTRKVNA